MPAIRGRDYTAHLREPSAAEALEEVHSFCANANAEASREGKPDAASAYARVMKLIREIQRRGA